jgi:DNA-binding NarL/FixJ family response regulator
VTAKIRIVLADDHPIVLNGLRNLIRTQPDLELLGEAVNGREALTLIRATRPDVAVVDISMPELNGILLSRRLADEMSSVKIIVLTLHEDRAYLKQALEAKVRGYVLKRSAAENLVQAIRAVVVGGLYLDPAMANRMFDATPKRAGRLRSGGGVAPELTDREAEVLKLAALGFTNKEIACKLDVGIKSIETYKARGAEKLGLKTRAELVRYASAQGWLAGI